MSALGLFTWLTRICGCDRYIQARDVPVRMGVGVEKAIDTAVTVEIDTLDTVLVKVRVAKA